MHIYIKENQSVKRKIVRWASFFSLMGGLLLLFWSFYPIISFEISTRFFSSLSQYAPLSRNTTPSVLEQTPQSVLGSQTYSNNLRDFTQAHLWFPSKNGDQKNLNPAFSSEYYLSIPRLNIVRARVVVGGEDLAKSLVHYLPKTMPGEFGNVAIFGHSTLPQLYDEKDYKTIFTYLPSLEKNDVVVVHVGEVDYEYTIKELFVVNPDQVSVLDQKYDASYLTLVTCVPPGTFWKRLVVRAELSKLP